MFSFTAGQRYNCLHFQGQTWAKDYEHGPGKGGQGYKSNSFLNNRGRTKADD